MRVAQYFVIVSLVFGACACGSTREQELRDGNATSTTSDKQVGEVGNTRDDDHMSAMQAGEVRDASDNNTTSDNQASDGDDSRNENSRGDQQASDAGTTSDNIKAVDCEAYPECRPSLLDGGLAFEVEGCAEGTDCLGFQECGKLLCIDFEDACDLACDDPDSCVTFASFPATFACLGMRARVIYGTKDSP